MHMHNALQGVRNWYLFRGRRSMLCHPGRYYGSIFDCQSKPSIIQVAHAKLQDASGNVYKYFWGISFIWSIAVV